MARGGIPNGGQMSELWRQQRCPGCAIPSHRPDRPVVVCGNVGGRCVCANCGCEFELQPIAYWTWLGVPSPPPEWADEGVE
jgi:hypothetical protein